MAEPLYVPMECHRAVRLFKRIWRVDANWTGDAFFMQVRKVPDAASAVYLDLELGSGLTLEYAGSATVSAHVAAGRLPPAIYDQVNAATGNKYVGTDVVTVSVLVVEKLSSGTDSFPYLSDHEKDVELHYDIVRDPGGNGLLREKVFYGPFTVKPTVSRP